MDYQDIYNPHYYGRGRVHVGVPLRPYEPEGVDLMPPGRFVGNVRSFAITPQVESLQTLAWDTRSNLVLQGITARLELYGHGGDNLAMALGGAHVQTVGSLRVDWIDVDRLSLPADSMLFTRQMIDVTRPIEVAPTWTDWTEGVHWERGAYGIRLLAGMSGPAGGAINVHYTSLGGAQRVEGASAPAREMSISYAGVNRVDQVETRVDCYRCRAVLDGDISVISSEAGILALSINILPARLAHGAVRWYRKMRAPHIAGHHVQ